MKGSEHENAATVPMEMPFLDKLAYDWYHGVYGDRDSTTIVLPGKRARLFLQQAIARIASQPVWAPEVLTMEEFVYDHLNLESVDEITLALTLWEVVCNTPDHGVTFEQFSGWASIVLQDFNDVDLYLADAKQVFTNLLDARELQLWIPGEQDELSPYEIYYLRFYGQLAGWYSSLQNKLLSKQTAYQGMAFRMLAENPSKLTARKNAGKVIFAGFNALTPSEERMIHTLAQSGSGSVIWDADLYLLDPRQEAGHFIRRWHQRYPGTSTVNPTTTLAHQTKNINVYGLHGNRAQARFAGELLMEAQTDLKTAVVLPDESLLLPVLNSIPPHITRFNVSMGLSFRHTPALSWLNLNLQLLVGTGHRPGSWIRVTHLLPLLRHPWLKLLTEPDHHTPARLKDPAASLDRRFYPTETLINILSKVWSHKGKLPGLWLAPVTTPLDFIDRMDLLLREMLNSPSLCTRPFDNGAITTSLKLLKRLADALPRDTNPAEGFAQLRFLLSRLLQQTSIPFSGEPLEGLQILGLLETRNLDFDHIILLSANERVLPAARKPQTLIPWDIRRFHDLPGVQHQDAIYAYHFYHLLQRARRIDILYNTDVSSDLSGEASRFIRQIETELIHENPAITYQHQKLSSQVRKADPLPALSIPKSEPVLTTLKQLLTTRGLAPSNMSHYVRCPLMFYFSYVAGLREPEEIEESLDFRELGTLVHAALQSLYDPGQADPEPKSTMLTESLLRKGIEEADLLIGVGIRKIIGGQAPLTGRNLIIAEVASFMVQRFLMKELEVIKTQSIEVVGVEQELTHTLLMNIAGDQTEIKFKGYADRIDRTDGILRVGDYKTGKTDARDLAFESIGELFTDPGKEKAFQLATYIWLLEKQHPGEPITAAIFTLKSPQNYQHSLSTKIGQSTEVVRGLPEGFEEGIRALVNELLDPSRPFAQTEDRNICKLCAYLRVCIQG